MTSQRRALLWACLVGCHTLLPPRLQGQVLEVRPEQSAATLGDPITLRITARMPPGMQLIDAAPHPLVPPPRGIRLLATDTLRPHAGGIYTGTARVAFYRIGPQPVPTLALLYRAGPGEPPDTLLHMPVSVEITPILPAGNPWLKDIKPLQAIGGPAWLPPALLMAAILVAFWWLRRRSRLDGSTTQRLDSPPAQPFDRALARLETIERGARASGNGIVPSYTDTAVVVRDLLLEIGAIPHHGLTTPEVGATLPPALAAGDLRARCEALLGDADLVKFARVRPDFAAAERQLARARALLEAWRDTAEPPSRRAAE
ncbi:MAG TPA: hypothetical protein VH879_09355 [Gemmatimonadales bacterium]